MHQHIRDLKRKHRGIVSTSHARMRRMIHSGRLEERKIDHPLVSKSEFLADFHDPRTRKSLVSIFHPRSLKLPRAYSKLLGRRTWTSPTPLNLRLGTTAWVWWKHYCANGFGDQGVPMDDAWLTKVVPPRTLLVNLATSTLHMCLESVRWAAVSVAVSVEHDAQPGGPPS